MEDLGLKYTQIIASESISYAAAVVSVRIHGQMNQSWPVTEKLKVLVSLKHFNAKFLARIFDIGVDEAYKNHQKISDILQSFICTELPHLSSMEKTTVTQNKSVVL